MEKTQEEYNVKIIVQVLVFCLPWKGKMTLPRGTYGQTQH